MTLNKFSMKERIGGKLFLSPFEFSLRAVVFVNNQFGPFLLSVLL